MFCPKCGASLKDGAKFCHSCGFNMVETPAAPQPQQPQQQPQYQQQPQQPAVQGQGFDFSKITVKEWIYAGIAFTGVIAVFLPWVTVSFGPWGHASSGGLNSAFGVFSLLVFLGIAGLVLFGKLIGLTEDVSGKILKFAPLGVISFCLIDVIRFLARSHGYAKPGFGLIIAILVSVALVLIGFKVIKLK